MTTKGWGAVLKFSEGDESIVSWDGKLIIGTEEDMRFFAGKMLVQLVPVSDLCSVPTIDIREHAPAALFERIDKKNGKSA